MTEVKGDFHRQAMALNYFQQKALTTAQYPRSMAIPYCTMKLCGEAGEVAEKVAKAYRDAEGKFSAGRVEAIGLELGDVLWYVANLATEFGLTLESIAAANIEKLSDRTARGVIKGDGDNR